MAEGKAETRLVRMQRGLAGYLEKRKGFIEAVLPPKVNADRLLKVAIVAALENPKIAECDPVSVFRSVAQAAMLNLEPGTAVGECYFVPYKDQCTMQAGYRGWLKMVRGPDIRQVVAGVVYTGDEFEFTAAPRDVKHKPCLDDDSGELRGAYAVAYGHDGQVFDATWVTVGELKKAKAMADKHKPSPAWASWPDEMRKKTAIKRLCKTLPLGHQAKKMWEIEAGAEDGRIVDPDIDDTETIIEMGPAEPEKLPEGKQKLGGKKPKQVEEAQDKINEMFQDSQGGQA